MQANTFQNIGPGDTVRFSNRFGQERNGRAVMFNRQYQAWVLNAGGPHGTPKIVDATNFVRIVRKAR